jgi:serine/threonine-protein kinase
VTTEPKSGKLEERSPVRIGDLVAGRYRVVELIAAGGMGVIVGARHETLGQNVAIKLLLPDSDHSQRAERFLREARAAAAIESSHVCRVFDCGEHDGIPFMVMEHLVGHDLAHELKARGPLPPAEAVDLVLQALEGIAEAHAIGIVHRDLKPSNLFLSQRPGRAREVKVLDFGISKLTPAFDASDAEDLTHTEMMLGSPRYMSPEQVQNARGVDARTDLWSIGVILYQLLDGQSPFAGTTMGETIGKVLTHDAPPIGRRRPDVPAGLAEVLGRCLERDRERRYRNVAELALALAPFGSGAARGSVERITALLVGGQLDAAPPLAAAPAVVAPSGARHKPADEPSIGTVGAFTQGALRDFRPKRTGLYIGLALAIAALAGGAVLLARGSAEEGAPPAASAPPPPVATTTTPTSTPSAASAAPVATQAEPAPVPAASESTDAAPATSAPPVRRTRGPATSRRRSNKPDDILSESY